MSFNNPIRLFHEPNVGDQSAYNDALKETRNLTSEIKNNFSVINGSVKNINIEIKSVNQSVDVFLNKLKTSKGLVGSIKSDFDKIGKKSPKIEIKTNLSQNVNDSLKEAEKNSGNVGKALVAGLAGGSQDATQIINNLKDGKTLTDQTTNSTKEKSQEDKLISLLLRNQRETLKAINDELKGGFNYTKEVRKQYGLLEDIATKLVDNDEELLELTEKQLEKEKTKASLAIKRLKEAAEDLQLKRNEIELTRELTDQEQALLRAAEDRFEIEEATVKNIEKQLDRQKQINKAVGITGSLLKSIEKISGKLGITGLEKVFKNANKEAAKTAKELLSSEKNMSMLTIQTKTMGAGLKELGKGIIGNLKDPLVILGASLAAIGLSITLLKKFFNLYGEINQRIVDQRRQLALSNKESEELYRSSVDFAASQNDGFTTAKKLAEARQKINETLGTSIVLSEKEAQTAAKLTHFYGLSDEQNANLYATSKRLGVSNKDILNTVLKTAVTQKAQFGGTVSYQKVLQKVSSVSGDILTKFKGNIGALTAAVMQADRLGLTLEQVDKVGESLLNFESSIENELKAELLTGKAINLERARSAALSGDTAKLMTEIKTQVGSIHNFEKMNVIQRKAYAEAFGMTADEMGDMLRKQEFEAKLAGSGAKSAQDKLDFAQKHGIAVADSLKKDLEAQSLAELQKTTFEKIRDTLARITEGPMKKLYGFLEKGLNFVEKILKGFNKMTGGGLGSALGAAILGIPAVLGAIGIASSLFRLFSGQLIKNAFLPKPGETVLRPMFVTVTNPGMMSGPMAGRNFAGMTLAPAAPMAPGMGPRPYTAPKLGGPMVMGPAPAAGPKGFSAFSPKAMGVGMGVGMAGMALNMASEGMEEGGAKQAVGVLGQTAQFAGMGAMFGPWGAAIGGLVGLGMGLFSLSKENEERRKAEEAKREESTKQTNELIERLSVRPLALNVNNETIGKWNTYSSQNGSNPSFA